MLKIGLIGYGKMGKMIEKLSGGFNIKVVSRIDPSTEEAEYDEISEESLKDCDVCIDFSTPSSVKKNIKKVVELNKPLVVGTTGWYESLDIIKGKVNESGSGLIYGTNFSIGVNILFKMVEYGNKLFNQVDGYDVGGFESHHNMKQDIPSGTGETLANIILEGNDSKKKIVYQPGNRKIAPEELHFTSLRCGTINGMHQIIFDSSEDQVQIQHNAKNREGFAKGALVAAKYISKNKGVYNFMEVFNEILEGGYYGN